MTELAPDIAAVVDAALALIDKPVPQPHQRPPEDPNWDLWVTAGGRNSGKSFGGMLWLADYAREHPGLRARIIAPTLGDAIESCVEGPSGLKRFAPEGRFHASDPGGSKFKFPKDKNGRQSVIFLIGTPTPRDVDRLRATGNVHVDVFEEFAANPQHAAAWEQAELSRRAKDFDIPNRAVVATTPRPIKLLKLWAKTLGRAYVRVSSHANRFADKAWLAKRDEAKGTRLYRQEVLGEILDDVVGALWTLTDIERSTVPREGVELVRYAIGVDPPSGNGTCGIVVLGADIDGRLYVVADYSISEAGPNQWARQVIAAYDKYGGVIVAERNQGGKMVAETLNNVRKASKKPVLPIKTVWAAVGKQARAEPIAVLWEAEQQAGHFFADTMADLELLVDQLTSWVPPGGENAPSDFSPDRLDALVWAGHHLRGTGFGEERVSTRQVAARLPGW